MNIISRILTAVIGIPLAVVLVFWPTEIPFSIAIAIVSMLAAHEFYKGICKIGARPIRWVGILAVALFVVSARKYTPSSISSIFPAVLTGLIFLSFIVEMTRSKRAPLLNIGSTIYGAIYVGWLISHLVVLRNVTGKLTVCNYTSDTGAWFVMFTFLCTWACDTGAYFMGKSFGKNKLAPQLSPHKTVEGAIGGLVSTIFVSCVCIYLMGLSLWHGLLLGIICGILSQAGDLSASAIKREIGIKDFGKIVPGHGGVLDRFDSLLFTAPAVYYYVIIVLKDLI